MQIKEILLNGGVVYFSYKEKRKDFMGTAKIISLGGSFGLKPKIIVEVPTIEINGRKEFQYQNLDEAIILFKRLVFNVKNMCFKRHEAVVNLTNMGFEIDLDEDEDFNLVEEERNRLINRDKNN